MKTTINYNGKDVVIELTNEQLAEAKKQSSHYTDIKTFQDALDYIGESLENFNYRTQFDDDCQRAGKELEVIVLAVRQGNELGHEEDDYWYYPYFYSKRSSVGFSYDVYLCADSGSGVGSRLCVESSEKAKYLGTQFTDIYDRMINGGDIHVKQYPSPLLAKRFFESYTDIKTFDDACACVGIDPKTFHESRKNLSHDTYAYEQLKVISKALNGGTHMDYTDTDVYKYYPYFKALGSSVGFSYCVCICDSAFSSVGSRLTYKSREIAEYAGKQFLDIYNKYIN